MRAQLPSAIPRIVLPLRPAAQYVDDLWLLLGHGADPGREAQPGDRASCSRWETTPPARCVEPPRREQPRERSRDPLAHHLGSKQSLGLRARERSGLGGARPEPVEHRDDRDGHALDVARSDRGGDRPVDLLDRADLGRRHDRHAGGERLRDGQRERLVLARLQQYVAGGRAPPARASTERAPRTPSSPWQILEQRSCSPTTRSCPRQRGNAASTSRSSSSFASATTSSSPFPGAMRPRTMIVGGVPSGLSVASKRSRRTGFGTTAVASSRESVVADQMCAKHVADADHRAARCESAGAGRASATTARRGDRESVDAVGRESAADAPGSGTSTRRRCSARDARRAAGRARSRRGIARFSTFETDR